MPALFENTLVQNDLGEQSPVVKTIASQEFHTWDIHSLIDYIINIHHRYAKDNTVIIYDLAQKVSNRQCENHPQFGRLTSEIFFFFHDLLNHMMKEEEILFPNIKQLIENRRISGKAIYTTFGLIKDSIRLRQKEHNAAGEYLKSLRKYTNNYKAPVDASNSCEILFKKMEEFETDLLVHVHLESNILFPKAIALDEVRE